MEKTRVLQILDSINVNGTEMFIMNVFRNMDHNEIMFDFLVSQRTFSAFEKEFESHGSKIYTFTRRNRGILKHIASLKEFFRAHGKDYKVAHIHGNSFTSMMPLAEAKNHGIPIRIAHCHNTSTQGIHNRLLHNLNRLRIDSIATDFFACSEAAKEWGFKGTKGFGKALVVPNGIELEKFAFNETKRSEVRKELNLGDSFVVGNVAAFRDAKNHPFMLKTFKEITRRYQNAKLMLVGDGDGMGEMKEMAKRLRMEKDVLFLGSRSDIPDLLQAMDLFLFPSKYEGLGIVAIEAQAAGLPVMTSTHVPTETAATPLIQYLDLASGPEEWASKILEKTEGNDRSLQYDGMKKFDIKTTCDLLRTVYLRSQ